MLKIKCKLISSSISHIIQHLYTGFFILYKNRIIDLSQEVKKENYYDVGNIQHLRDARKAHLCVILNSTIKLYYDVHDSWEIDEEKLDDSDFYFKCNFSVKYLKNLGKNIDKIYPLGLKYIVYPDYIDKFALERSVRLSNSRRERLFEIFRSLCILDSYTFIPRHRFMWSLPDYDAAPKILFMTRAWDPYDNPDRTKDKIEERISMNETRSKCIRLLRSNFGDDFYGGFSHDKFAIENYRDCLIADSSLSAKGNYIKLLMSFPICVTTTALHGTIGAKLGEYVAFSKAILSEKLNPEVPGFENGENYLEFNTPEECVAKARQLFSDTKLRKEIMLNNAKYYQSYLKPDSLILHTLLLALSK